MLRNNVIPCLDHGVGGCAHSTPRNLPKARQVENPFRWENILRPREFADLSRRAHAENDSGASGREARWQNFYDEARHSVENGREPGRAQAALQAGGSASGHNVRIPARTSKLDARCRSERERDSDEDRAQHAEDDPPLHAPLP